MVRRCWINFQCRGVLLIWIIGEQGPIVLAVGTGGGCLDVFSLLFLPLWETVRYKVKYCLKGPLNPNQPTNQPGDVIPKASSTINRLHYQIDNSMTVVLKL